MPTAPDPVILAAPPSNAPAAPGNATGSGAVAVPNAPPAIQPGGLPAEPEAPSRVSGQHGDVVVYLDILGDLFGFLGQPISIPRMFDFGPSYNGKPRWASLSAPDLFVPAGWECVYDNSRWKIRKFGLVSPQDPQWWTPPTTADSPDYESWETSASPVLNSTGEPYLSRYELVRTRPDEIQPGGQPDAPTAPGNATGSGTVSAPTAPTAIQAGGQPSAPTAPGNATGSGTVSAPTAPSPVQP